MEIERATNGNTAKPIMTVIERKHKFDWEGLRARVEAQHWRTLRLTIQLRDRLHAGKPAQLNAANAMLAARGLTEVVEAREAERPVDERVDEIVEQGLCEFHRREGKTGIWWPSNNMKACVKENWQVLGFRMDATPPSKRKDDDGTGKPKKKLQGSRAAIAEGLFVSSTNASDRDWIFLGEKPDGIDMNVSHTTGPKGDQHSIKRNEYVLRPTMVFDIMTARAVVDKIPDESLTAVLIHASEHGIGANRSQGMGRFDVVSFEEL